MLLLRDIVIFPYMIAPLFVGREKSKNAIDQSLSTNRMILLLTQKDMEAEDPKREEVYEMGTVALIMRMLKLPDGRVRILAQGLIRARIDSFEEDGAYVTAGSFGHPRTRQGREDRSRAKPSSATSAPASKRPPRSGKASLPRSSSSPPTSTNRDGWRT